MKYFFVFIILSYSNLSYCINSIDNNLINGCTDSEACNFDVNASVDDGSCEYLEVSILSQSNTSCFNGSDGEASISIFGGSGNYSTSWDNLGQTGESVFNLSEGVYNFIIQDELNECTLDSFIIIDSPNDLVITLSKNDISCFADDNGAIFSSVSGGTQSYNYFWTDQDGSSVGGNSTSISNLSPGQYTLQLIDANNCVAIDSIIIIEPTQLSSSIVSVTDATCFGSTNGSAEVEGLNATPDYTYEWSDGQIGALATGLGAGQYTCTVTDDNGCEIDQPVTIGQPTQLSSSIVIVTDATCFGSTNGSAEVEGLNATPDYTYEWSDGQIGALATGLGAGQYTCTVTDDNGCEIDQPVTIGQSTQLSSSIVSVTDATCFGFNNGSAEVEGLNATPDYTYEWSNGQTGALATGLGAGQYTCTVTDDNGCEIDQPVTIGHPNDLVITLSKNDISCFADDNGAIFSSVSGGTQSYNYFWTDQDGSSVGGNSTSISNLSPGQYTL